LSRALTEDTKQHEAVFFADKVKDAEIALARAQQDFPDDADIIQVEARFRQELDQEDRALRALERAWNAGPRGSGAALRIAKVYEARGRLEDAHKILMDALARNPDDKAVHQAIATHHLRRAEYDEHLWKTTSRKAFPQRTRTLKSATSTHNTCS
jgi:tetratricopeptide (TPR) repeat protein